MGGHPRMAVQVSRLDDRAIIPEYGSAGASGFDLHALMDEEDTIMPGKTGVVNTGLAFAIPAGFELQVRPRSGLALKHALTVMNTPGTVDSDYRGEVKVLLHNHGEEPFSIKPNDRIAQGVICPVFQADIVLAEQLDGTERGAGGFGSTGVSTNT